MAVERRDGVLQSLFKTHNPITVARGKRTWSLMDNNETQVTTLKKVPLAVAGVGEGIKPIQPDKISYWRIRVIAPGFSLVEYKEQAFGEEINALGKPWSGRVRWRPGFSSQSPEKPQ